MSFLRLLANKQYFQVDRSDLWVIAMRSKKVVLVEDSELLQEMMTEVLDSIPNLDLVGVADGQTKALTHIKKNKPDLVIVDLELVEGDGVGVLKALDTGSEIYGQPEKVVFTNHTSSRLKSKCEQFDISGYFDKSYQLEELTDYLSQLACLH